MFLMILSQSTQPAVRLAEHTNAASAAESKRSDVIPVLVQAPLDHLRLHDDVPVRIHLGEGSAACSVSIWGGHSDEKLQGTDPKSKRFGSVL